MASDTFSDLILVRSYSIAQVAKRWGAAPFTQYEPQLKGAMEAIIDGSSSEAILDPDRSALQFLREAAEASVKGLHDNAAAVERQNEATDALKLWEVSGLFSRKRIREFK